MPSNADIVRQLQDAISRGQIIETMGYLARDVRWAVNTMDRQAAPWFEEYRGRAGVAAFFEAISQVDVTDFEIKAVIGEGDVVVVWLHFACTVPNGRCIDMDETQVWQFGDGMVKAVDLFPDTLAVASAFA